MGSVSLACVYLALVLIGIALDLLGRGLHSLPDPTSNRFTAGLLQERFDLIDPLVDRAQAHTTLKGGTPVLSQVTQTLAQATAKECLLLHIQLKVPIILQDGVGAGHIMPTFLTFQHWDLHSLQMSPNRFQ
jgi:hypothetical protein